MGRTSSGGAEPVQDGISARNFGGSRRIFAAGAFRAERSTARRSLLSRVRLLLNWGALALSACVFLPSQADAATIPKSVSASGVPAVGALFTLAKNGSLGAHFCTASVIASPSGNLVLTAAHCISGRSARAFVFVPAYHDGRAPYGVWTVTATAVNRAWANSKNPDDDFAFLTVFQGSHAKSLQATTGAEHLGINLPPGPQLTVVGYPDSAPTPVGCENVMVLFSSTQLQFNCDGYTDGTSGSPLVVGFNPATGVGTVVGVIGGFEEGGNTPSVSYAARFETNMATLFKSVAAV
jgi:V8-like Glu-specific endopeptidase